MLPSLFEVNAVRSPSGEKTGRDAPPFLNRPFVRFCSTPVLINESRTSGTLLPRYAEYAIAAASCDHEGFRFRSREFVMRDADGHVDKVRVDLTANPALLSVLNTTAGRQSGAGEERVA